MSTTLIDAWNQTVRAAPNATALIDASAGNVISLTQLDTRANEWLERHPLRFTGKTVVLCEPNGPGWWHVFLGLLKAGAVIAPLDPGEPPAAQRAVAAAIRGAWLWSEGAMHMVTSRARSAPDDRRLIKLTSGSTGTPRALAFTDAQMLADGRQVCVGMGITGADVNLGLIPFGHSYGLGNLVVPLLAQGTAIVCGAAALPYAVAETVARWRPTVFPAVPAVLRALANSDVPPCQLDSLRTVISAGALLAPEVATAFHARFGRKVHSFYGSSETGGITYDRAGEAALTGRSVGTALPGVRLVFGRGGRFVVESAAVYTIGNRRRAADGGGAHRPGDVAALAANGELTLVGRAGRVVKIGGRRLNLAEVERALKQIAGVRDVMVLPHASRADALAAAVATDITPDQLRLILREQIAPWKIPKQIVTMPAFPLTARGKMDAARVRQLLGAE